MDATSYAVLVGTLLVCVLLVVACRSWASSVAPEPAPRRVPLALPASTSSSEATPAPGVPVMGLPGVTVPAEALASLSKLGELGDVSDLAGVLGPSDAAFLAVLSLVLDEGGRR